MIVVRKREYLPHIRRLPGESSGIGVRFPGAAPRCARPGNRRRVPPGSRNVALARRPPGARGLGLGSGRRWRPHAARQMQVGCCGMGRTKVAINRLVLLPALFVPLWCTRYLMVRIEMPDAVPVRFLALRFGSAAATRAPMRGRFRRSSRVTFPSPGVDEPMRSRIGHQSEPHRSKHRGAARSGASGGCLSLRRRTPNACREMRPSCRTAVSSPHGRVLPASPARSRDSAR